MKNIFNLKFGIISFAIIYENENIISINFTNNITPYNKYTNNFEREIFIQFDEYFNGKRKYFTLPYIMHGTEFQKNVYLELLKIPYGKTVSYKDIASKIGNVNACRAVGNANHHNKLPIIIPCHRVINSNGELGGYAGGIEIKKFLINLEKNYGTAS